ncbi:MAG: DUF4114 domain-containing protein [Phycisphaerae bacterium]|nr:DUF4114 domain-containing protein [Phycisphaerae bacterium]
MRKNLISFGSAMIVAVFCGTIANAGFVRVSMPTAGGEASHTSILEAYYSSGSAWIASGTRTDDGGTPVDFTNGVLTATRVSDSGLGGTLDPAAQSVSLADDAQWVGWQYDFQAVARYASYSQQFGYDLDGDGLGFVNLFDLSGSGMNVTGSASLTLDAGQTLAWVRGGSGYQYSSRSTDNVDQLDHMVTYRITGLGDGKSHYMLFWEDLTNGGDRDYNDLVVEAVAVPEPSAIIGLFVTAAIVALRRNR